MNGSRSPSALLIGLLLWAGSARAQAPAVSENVADAAVVEVQRLVAASGGRSVRFAAATEILATRPWFEDNVSFTALTNGDNTRDVRSFNTGFDVAPRVWFGYFHPNGLGIRTRYWTYDQSIGPATAVDTGAAVKYESVLFSGSNITESIFKLISADGDTFTVGAGVETHVLDLEGTLEQALSPDLLLTASGGLRYAHLTTTFDGMLVDGTSAVAETISQRISYDGLGLTLAADGRRALRGGFSLFAGARISTLFGTAREAKDFLSMRTASKTFDRKADELLIIFESPAGLRWETFLPSGIHVFAQGQVEAQVWANAGNLQADVNSLGFLSIGGALGAGF